MPEEESEQDFETKYFGAYNKKNASNDTEEEHAKHSERKLGSGEELEKAYKLHSSLKREKSSTTSTIKMENDQKNSDETQKGSKGSVDFNIPEATKSQELLRPSFHKEQRESVR